MKGRELIVTYLSCLRYYIKLTNPLNNRLKSITFSIFLMRKVRFRELK